MNYENALHFCRLERIKYEIAERDAKMLRPHRKTGHDYNHVTYEKIYFRASQAFENCMMKAMSNTIDEK